MCRNPVGFLGLLGFFGFKWVYLVLDLSILAFLCVCACKCEGTKVQNTLYFAIFRLVFMFSSLG